MASSRLISEPFANNKEFANIRGLVKTKRFRRTVVWNAPAFPAVAGIAPADRKSSSFARPMTVSPTPTSSDDSNCGGAWAPPSLELTAGVIPGSLLPPRLFGPASVFNFLNFQQFRDKTSSNVSENSLERIREEKRTAGTAAVLGAEPHPPRGLSGCGCCWSRCENAKDRPLCMKRAPFQLITTKWFWR